MDREEEVAVVAVVVVVDVVVAVFRSLGLVGLASRLDDDLFMLTDGCGDCLFWFESFGAGVGVSGLELISAGEKNEGSLT